MISLTKKLLSVALAVVLLLGAFPATVFAAGPGEFDVNFYASKADFEGGKAPLVTVPVKANTPVDLTKAPAKSTLPAVAGMTPTGNWIYCVHGTVYANGTDIVDTTNLYPEYVKTPEKTKYQVSYNTNCELANPAAQMVEDGTAIALPKLNREGYTLTEWAPTGLKGGESYTVTGNIELTAQWVRNQYSVEFLDKDGKVIHSESVRHGEKIVSVPALSKAGVKDGMQAVDWDGDTSVAVTGKLTFKPVYKANDYKITFDPNSPKLVSQTKGVTYGEKIGPMPVYELTDYVFDGWYLDGVKYTANSIYNFDHNITLTAKWVPAAVLEIHIYRNGKTASAYGEPVVFNVPVGATVDLSEIDISDYYTASKSFKFEGYFDKEGWRAYKANENAKPIQQVKTIDPADGIVELYCMVTDKDVSPEPSTKPTTKPADPSNPQTGDNSMIIATSAAMLVSAGALMLIMIDRKRRMA